MSCLALGYYNVETANVWCLVSSDAYIYFGFHVYPYVGLKVEIAPEITKQCCNKTTG